MKFLKSPDYWMTFAAIAVMLGIATGVATLLNEFILIMEVVR